MDPYERVRDPLVDDSLWKYDRYYNYYEMYVVAELSGFIDNDFLTTSGSTHKVLGLDSDQPYIQIGNNIFQGRYEHALGTSLLFEDITANTEDSEVTKPDPKLTYFGKTDKTLHLQKVFLNEKHAPDTDSESTTPTDVREIISVPGLSTNTSDQSQPQTSKEHIDTRKRQKIDTT